MADQQDRGGNQQGKSDPGQPERRPGGQTPSPDDEAERQRERDRQNRDDPSRAPESGDRK